MNIRRAFGWSSQVPGRWIKETLPEIKKVGSEDKVRAVDGAMILPEKITPPWSRWIAPVYSRSCGTWEVFEEGTYPARRWVA